MYTAWVTLPARNAFGDSFGTLQAFLGLENSTNSSTKMTVQFLNCDIIWRFLLWANTQVLLRNSTEQETPFPL